MRSSGTNFLVLGSSFNHWVPRATCLGSGYRHPPFQRHLGSFTYQEPMALWRYHRQLEAFVAQERLSSRVAAPHHCLPWASSLTSCFGFFKRSKALSQRIYAFLKLRIRYYGSSMAYIDTLACFDGIYRHYSFHWVLGHTNRAPRTSDFIRL